MRGGQGTEFRLSHGRNFYHGLSHGRNTRVCPLGGRPLRIGTS